MFCFYNKKKKKIKRLFLVGVQVQMDVGVSFIQDHLKGDGQTEIRVRFIKRIEDAIPAGED